MTMTTKEKLDKCIEFLGYIENMSNEICPTYGIADCYDEDAGMNEIRFNINYPNQYRDKLNTIIEKAWHLKADISE